MKKFLSVILLFAVLLSCCACGNKGEGSTEPSLDPASPEAMFGHIDQTVKMDGYFKIWNAEGVQNMLKNPGEKYELLCNVDMEGAVIAPVAEFTGTIKGGNFGISNFTVQGGDETDFGFISVNKGDIRNFLIENVTFIPGKNAKNIGSLVGNNQGNVMRCTVSGTMNVENPAENVGSLVGISTGKLQNAVVTVDLNYTGAGAANVGGIVGTIQGGIVEFIDTNGKLDVTDCAQKSVGLFAGDATGVVFKSCAFVGASNTQDGKLFTNFTGNADDDELVVCTDALWRDNYKEPLTEGQNKLRDRVVAEMNAMATVEWHLYKDLKHSCTCSLSSCHGVYNTTYTYRGIPYNHKGGSLERMKYALDEDGYIKDWLYDMESYDGFDLYIGNDCSTGLINAWWTVSNSVDFSRVTYEIPVFFYDSNFTSGCIPVGTGWWEEITTLTKENGKHLTKDYIDINGEQVMMEAYAQMRKGDAYAYLIEAGGHTRMAAEDPVVVRDQQGLINSTYSYVITTEQGSTTVDDTNMVFSSWKCNYKYTFGSLLEVWAVPVTCEELLTGEMETPECTLEDSVDGYAGMYTGTVKSNYNLDSVELKITDSQGNEVLNHKMFVTVDKRHDIGHNDGLLRNYVDEYDLVSFAMPLSKIQLEKGETYSYTITGNLHTYDSFVLKEASFTFGQA